MNECWHQSGEQDGRCLGCGHLMSEIETTKAEQALALRGEPVAWMINYREITRGGSVRRVTSPSLVDEVPSMLLPWDENVISRELISSTSLYAAPISGEQLSAPARFLAAEGEYERRMDAVSGERAEDKKSIRNFNTEGWIDARIAVSGERVREACAKVVEDMACPDLKPPFRAAPGYEYFTAAAKAIRALPLAAQPEGK